MITILGTSATVQTEKFQPVAKRDGQFKVAIEKGLHCVPNECTFCSLCPKPGNEGWIGAKNFKFNTDAPLPSCGISNEVLVNAVKKYLSAGTVLPIISRYFPN